MGSQSRWREPGAERPLVGVFQERGQLEQEQRKAAANGRRLPGREQRDKEMLSPRLTRTWRFVKGIGTAAAQAGGTREEPLGACGDSLKRPAASRCPTASLEIGGLERANGKWN